MKIQLIEREAFCICGYAVKTTSADNDRDIASLYEDFFSSGKESILRNLNGTKDGYYGLSWYTEDHTRYCYLLGVEAGRKNAIPEGAVLKEVPKTTFAMASFPQGEDIIKAWTAFFFDEIPNAGLKVDENVNLYFEYYPGSVRGAYELWVPVVKAEN